MIADDRPRNEAMEKAMPAEHAPTAVQTAIANHDQLRSGMGELPVEAIRVREGYNVRLPGAKYEERIESLTQSILANGYLKDKPITVQVVAEDGQEAAYVASGHTRLLAVKRANERGADITVLPVLFVPADRTGVDLTLDLVLANDGAPLTLYEQGIVNARLVESGLSMSEIARRQGVSEGHIRNTLEMQSVPAEVVAWLADGVIAETFALEMWRKHGDKVVDVITRGLERAAEMGKVKVTAAAVEGPRIPPKVGVAAVSAVEAFMSKLPADVLERLGLDADGSSPETLANDEQPVTIPAGVLRELLSANKEISDFRSGLAEKEEKARLRQQKAQEREARRAEREAKKAEREAKKAEREAKRAQPKDKIGSIGQMLKSQPLAAAAPRVAVSVTSEPVESDGYERDRIDSCDLPDYEAMMNQAGDDF